MIKHKVSNFYVYWRWETPKQAADTVDLNNQFQLISIEMRKGSSKPTGYKPKPLFIPYQELDSLIDQLVESGVGPNIVGPIHKSRGKDYGFIIKALIVAIMVMIAIVAFVP